MLRATLSREIPPRRRQAQQLADVKERLDARLREAVESVFRQRAEAGAWFGLLPTQEPSLAEWAIEALLLTAHYASQTTDSEEPHKTSILLINNQDGDCLALAENRIRVREFVSSLDFARLLRGPRP